MGLWKEVGREKKNGVEWARSKEVKILKLVIKNGGGRCLILKSFKLTFKWHGNSIFDHIHNFYGIHQNKKMLYTCMCAHVCMCVWNLNMYVSYVKVKINIYSYQTLLNKIWHMYLHPRASKMYTWI